MADPLGEMGAILSARIKLAARQKMGNALLLGLSLLFLGVAILAAIGAIGVALAARWGALNACLIIAATALLLAIGLMLVVRWQTKVQRRRRRAEVAQLQLTLLALKAIVPELTTGKVLLIASALGVLVGMTLGSSNPSDKT